MKVVINGCYGGFGLSDKATDLYKELAATEYTYDFEWNLKNRNDANLVKVVEMLGEEANGDFAELKIIEIPDDVNWTVLNYDGWEWVAEVHRTWG